jgi:hypothetical protein
MKTFGYFMTSEKPHAASQARSTSSASAGAQQVVIQDMIIKRYRTGNFFEGTVANGADFPVYC